MELPRDFAKYQLTALVADGRMGRVFKAKSHGVEGFEKILCVKIIASGLAEQSAFVDTLIEEAKRVGSLSHANVAQIHDLGRDEETGEFYIASEFVNGYDVGRVLEVADETGLGLPIPLAVFIASEVAKGLDFAHRRKDFNFNNLNLVHRDICPSNVLLSFDGEVKISDFGISRALDTVPSSLEPDPERRYRYAPPEHARGQSYTHQSDLFGLGLVLYEMLSGTHPYQFGDGPMRDRAARANFPPIGEVTDLPHALERIVESMLVPDPAGRADSAGAVYEELMGFLFSNDLQGDNRALSLHMEELRRAHNTQQPGEDDAAGLDDISHADVEDFIDQSAGSGTSQPLEQAEVPGDDDVPELPGQMETYFASARQGEGKVVLMSGQFGRGLDYLPDRLGDVLTRRGDGRVLTVQASPDDVYRPLGVLSELILQCVAPDVPTSAPSDTVGFRRQALGILRELDVASEGIDIVSGLWGLGELPTMDQRERRDAISGLFFEMLDDYSFEEPIIAIVDRVERADALSIELLRDLVGEVAELPVLLVLSTSADEAMREAFDVGRPESLKAVRVAAEDSEPAGALDELSSAGARALLALALAEKPLSRTLLADVLEMPRRRLTRRLEELEAANLVRIPREDTYLIGVTEPGVWLRQHFEPEAIAEVANALARHIERRSLPTGPDLHTPTQVRLSAHAGAVRQMLDLADHYGNWLELNGWLEIALNFYGFCAERLSQRRVGSPQARIDYLLSQTELALELARAQEARDSLQPVAALVETARDDRGFARSQLLSGRMALQEDEPRRARRALSRATEVAQGMGDPVLLARCRLTLTRWWRRWGECVRALESVFSAETLAERAGFRRFTPDERAIAAALSVETLVDRGMVEQAGQYAGQLETLAARSGLARVECRAKLARATIAIGAGELAEALDRLDLAQSIADRNAPSSLSLTIKRRRAATALLDGQYQFVDSLADQLISTARRLDDAYTERRAGNLRAAANAAAGHDRPAALATLRDNLELAVERGIPRDVYRAHDHLAVALQAVDPEDARAHRAKARRLAERMRFVSA